MAERSRIQVYVDDETLTQVKYWAKKKDKSLSEYIAQAISLQIAWDNRDYDLGPLEVQRLNQLIDTITVLSSNVHSLEQVVTSGFDSLLGLTRGDNYLLDEDGTL